MRVKKYNIVLSSDGRPWAEKRLLTKIRLCTSEQLWGCSRSVSSKIAASFEQSKIAGGHFHLQILGRGI
jgi:hypothetical protein